MSDRVTPREVELMYSLYKEYGTYAEVARKMGRSASTVAKYIKAAGIPALSTAMKKKIK